MSIRSVLMVMLALLFGVSAAVGVGRYTRGTSGQTDMVDVVVMIKAVPRFQALTEDTMEVKQFPTDLVPPGAIARIEDAVNRVCATAMHEGDPVLEGKLTPRGSGSGVGSAIPVGMRAVTIRTPNVATGVAGFILPGNKVDVIFSIKQHQASDTTGGGQSKVIVQNVEIMAVDQRLEAPSENKVDAKELRSVTLLVTPEQASDIELAQTMGTLTLMIRNELDMGTITASSTLREILHGKRAPEPEPAPMPDERYINLIAKIEELEAKQKKMQEKQEEVPVAVAPPPVAKPAIPESPPKIRTSRAGIPGVVFIEK